VILRMSDDLFDRIVVDGKLDISAAAELLEVIKDAAAEDRDLLIDISEVEAIGFPALQVLAAAMKDFRGRKKQLMISRPSVSCEEIVELAGFKPLLYE